MSAAFMFQQLFTNWSDSLHLKHLIFSLFVLVLEPSVYLLLLMLFLLKFPYNCLFLGLLLFPSYLLLFLKSPLFPSLKFPFLIWPNLGLPLYKWSSNAIYDMWPISVLLSSSVIVIVSIWTSLFSWIGCYSG